MSKQPIDVFRLSASRPNQLKNTSQSLFQGLKYSGDLRYHLIESILVQDLSNKCIEYAKSLGYKIHIINPANGQGFAIDYALKNAVTSKYTVKWEDDFMPEVDIPLDDCVALMEKYPHINQICFNKRETMAWKWAAAAGGNRYHWIKEQRYFEVGGRQIPLVVKEKWWFGSAIWRTSFIKPLFKWWPNNTHNLLNDEVIMPLAGYIPGKGKNEIGKIIPTPEQVEKHVGCYIYGKTGDKRMVFHAGLGDSLWTGELQKKWEKEGRKIVGK